jgi:hypothetical protein
VVILVVLFYHPLLRWNTLLSGGDAANLFWPIKILVQQSIADHQIVPLWNPWSFMGAPLAASLQHAVFYPVDRVLFALLPAHAGIMVGNVLHLVLAGLGMYFFLRRGLRIGGGASIIAGAAFPCCAWFWGQQEHINQIASVSYLPWLAFVLWQFLQARITATAFVCGYSAIGALQFLTGHPQEAFYAHFLCGLLVLGKLIVSPAKANFVRLVLPPWFAAAALLGLLAAVQLIPTLELNSHSRRQFKDPTYAISFSMEPDLLLTYLAPHAFGSFAEGYYLRDAEGELVPDAAGNPAWDRRAYGEYGLFIGVPLLLLAVLGFATHLRRRLTWGLLLIGLCGLLLALGGNTDPRRLFTLNFTEFPQPGWSLHELFLRIFPPAQGFRVPARISILTTFALASLGARGIQFISERLAKGTRIPAMVAIGAAVILALYLPSRREKYHYPVDMEPVLARLDAQELLPPTLDNRMYRLTLEDDTRLINERHLGTTFLTDNPILTRFLVYQPHMNVTRQQPLVDGYEEGLVPTARFKDWLHAFNRNLRTARPEQDLLNLLGVARIYSDLPIDTQTYPSAEQVDQGLGVIYENPAAVGAAFWETQTAGIDFTRIDGPWWQGGEPLPGISTQRVDFGALDNWRGQNLAKIPTSIPNTNRISVQYALLKNSTAYPQRNAYLAMGWYPGWVLNGWGNDPEDRQTKPVEWASAVHAKLPYRAADIREGKWLLEYRPTSYKLGLFITAIGLAIWFTLWRGLRPR